MESPRRRVILDTDAKNEADDQFAIVHALLSPSLDVRGLIAAHFGTSRSNRSMEESREEIDLLLGLIGQEQQVTGSPGDARHCHRRGSLQLPVPLAVPSRRPLLRTIRSRSSFSVFQNLHRPARQGSCLIAMACRPTA
jgi:hypothetical protein